VRQAHFPAQYAPKYGADTTRSFCCQTKTMLLSGGIQRN